MTNCQICDKDLFKYKCPVCSIKYCSISCYQTHKTTQCEEAKNEENQKPIFVEDRIPQRLIFETIDTVPETRLKELENSNVLKELLRNKHLRDFLQELNEARNPWKAMKVAMTEPLFQEFADECLRIVEKET